MAQSQLIQAVRALQAAGLLDIGSVVSNGRTKLRSKKVSKADSLADKDASILASFKRRGFKDVVLLDRTDKSKPFNVRPFGRGATTDDQGNPVPATGWIGQGRVVRKGQKGVRGLFHISQTDALHDQTN